MGLLVPRNMIVPIVIQLHLFLNESWTLLVLRGLPVEVGWLVVLVQTSKETLVTLYQ